MNVKKEQGLYTEIAIFRVAEDKKQAFQAVRKLMLERIRSFPGFHSIETLVSLENPTLMVDYVKWTSAELAHAAAAQAMQDPQLAPAFAAMQVDFFQHFKEVAS
jgi:hypothetical protein